MAYQRQYFNNGMTLTAEHLNHIERGLEYIEKPLVLNADDLATYNTDPQYGDMALQAILDGKQILVKTPNADGGVHTSNYSPVYMYQVPNQDNNYLYLFYLRDEKQNIDLSAAGLGTIQMPVYGELKMRLSETYITDPLS